MKKFLFPILSLALVGAGCTNDEVSLEQNESDNQLQPLSIQAAVLGSEPVLPETRAIVYGSAFPNASEIGVHVAKGAADDANGNKGVPGTPYSTTYSTNQMFQFDGSVWTPNADYHLSSDKGTVYAYYPFDPDSHFDTAGTAAVPVSIQPTGDITVSSGSAATDNMNNAGAITTPAANESDFMYYAPGATRAIVNNRAHNAILTMQHALAQISFRIIKASNYPGVGSFTGYEIFDTDAGTSLVITGATSSAMSIVDGSLNLDTPVKGTISRNIIGYQLGTELSTATIVSNLVFPVPAVADGELSARFHIDGHDYTTTLPVTAGTSDAWLAGKNYLYSVTLSGTGIEIDAVSITDWITVDGGDIAIE